jgi:hypothetical protein
MSEKYLRLEEMFRVDGGLHPEYEKGWNDAIKFAIENQMVFFGYRDRNGEATHKGIRGNYASEYFGEIYEKLEAFERIADEINEIRKEHTVNDY